MKHPAVFLDRDGVLSAEKGYVLKVSDLQIFPYTSKCIRRIHDRGYLSIVITNQSGVARGLFSEQMLIKMNNYLQRETGVDAIYFCPHHKEKGIIPKYTIPCKCRKPAPGMIEQACEDFDIDLAKSFMVGDRAADIILAQSVGVKSVLLESGYGLHRLEEPVKPDVIMKDLKEFVNTYF